MNVSIRKWRLSDAQDLSNALNDKAVQDNLRDGLPFPYTVQHAKEYISLMLDSNEQNTFAFAIVLDDKAIGSIGVFRKDNIHNKTAELGYYIAKDFWNKGIGSVAVNLVCKYVFEHSDIIRIFAEPFSNNIASCMILQKNGFVLEGILRLNAFKNNKLLDMKMYSLLKSDFAKN